MTLHELRYYMEHRFLPELVFKYQFGFIADLINSDGATLASLYHDVAEENNEISPYSKEDFEIFSIVLDGGYKALEIHLPPPQEDLECFIIVLTFKLSEDDFTDLRFFTIEKSDAFVIAKVLKATPGEEDSSSGLGDKYSRPDLMLCEWTKEKEHRNYGSLPSFDRLQSRIECILREEKELSNQET